MNARDLLSPSHPLHQFFTRWVKNRHAQVGGGEELTVRKARKFLTKFPQYRAVKAAA
jgi:hypothetical protein